VQKEQTDVLRGGRGGRGDMGRGRGMRGRGRGDAMGRAGSGELKLWLLVMQWLMLTITI
jgi:hypothetical protein